MHKFILATAAALLVAGPALAETVATGSMLGHNMDEVKTRLAQMGYEVRKGEMEDGKIEVYVVKDGKTAEVYVDAATGTVAKLK